MGLAGMAPGGAYWWDRGGEVLEGDGFVVNRLAGLEYLIRKLFKERNYYES